MKPTPGQKWNLDFYDKPGVSLATFIGDYEVEKDNPFLPEMSAQFYRLEEGELDEQRPHLQDELYFVLHGERDLEVRTEDETITVKAQKGDLLYVPAKAYHKFKGHGQISLLVFFAPNYSGPPQ